MAGPKRTSHPVPRDKDEPQDVLERIAAIRGVQDYWEAELVEAVSEARRRDFTWREISRALGVTYQAVIQRFGSRLEP